MSNIISFSTYFYYTVIFGDLDGTFLTLFTGSQNTNTDKVHVETGNI